jgi:hypothetical protein
MRSNTDYRAPRAVIACAAIASATLLPGRAGQLAQADDFRIQTKVFAESAKKPISQHTTIFRGGWVYDFSEDSGEVVVFDTVGRRFVLLDPQERQRAEISLDQLDVILSTLRRKLSASDDEFTAFLSNSGFERVAGDKAGQVRFVAPWVRYDVQAAAAPNETTAAEYAAFSTNCTRLNALRQPSLLARLAVNDWLSQRKLIPASVRLVTFKKGTTADSPVVDAEFRSEHVLTPGLSEDDVNRLGKLEQWQTEFRPVSLAAYWHLAESGKQ